MEKIIWEYGSLQKNSYFNVGHVRLISSHILKNDCYRNANEFQRVFNENSISDCLVHQPIVSVSIFYHDSMTEVTKHPEVRASRQVIVFIIFHIGNPLINSWLTPISIDCFHYYKMIDELQFYKFISVCRSIMKDAGKIILGYQLFLCFWSYFENECGNGSLIKCTKYLGGPISRYIWRFCESNRIWSNRVNLSIFSCII